MILSGFFALGKRKWGTRYVHTVTFDDAGQVARAMRVYRQSTYPKSSYYADQPAPYSRKECLVLPCGAAGIHAYPERKAATLMA